MEVCPINSYVAQALLSTFEFQKPLQEGIKAPNCSISDETITLEKGSSLEKNTGSP